MNGSFSIWMQTQQLEHVYHFVNVSLLGPGICILVGAYNRATIKKCVKTKKKLIHLITVAVDSL